MPGTTKKPTSPKSLRLRAKITGQSEPPEARLNASGALAVLHDLASSPSTAASSLKLLHELQVHQVELDIQEEELRRAVADLEAALFRQAQLIDFAPAGFFSVDRSTVISELNRAGAQMLGFERDVLIGRNFDSFLDADSSRALHAALTSATDTGTRPGCALHFVTHDGVLRAAYASVGPDPDGHGILIVCVAISESGPDAPDQVSARALRNGR